MSRRPLLYDASGRAIRFSANAWDSSGDGRRAKNWGVTRQSINALLSGDVETIRDRSRDELRRNAWAKKSVDVYVANVVGTGIRPKPQTEDKAFRREILEAWEEWVEVADADGTCDLYGLQTLVTRAFREGGDAFVRFRPRRIEDGLPVPLQLQVLEAEMCDAAKNQVLEGGRVVRSGVEFDALGRRSAYWMFRVHPGEVVRPFSESLESVPVPADQIAAVFQVLRPGQVRGVPGLATVLAMLHEIREVDDAYVLRTKIQNLFATFEEVPGDGVSVFDPEAADEDDDGVPTPPAEPGEHILLPPGHKVTHSEPPSDGLHYEAFMRTKLRSIAAGAGVLYEHVSGDLAGVTFSSIRTGLIEVRRELEQIQRNVLVFQLCRKIWRRWFEAAVLSGRIRIPESERGNTSRLLRAVWTPPGWEYVEPEKDVKAAVRRIRSGLSSITREAAKLGIDVEELMLEIAADNERARELGLVLDSDPGSDADGAARAAAVGGDSGQSGEEGEGGRAAA